MTTSTAVATNVMETAITILVVQLSPVEGEDSGEVDACKGVLVGEEPVVVLIGGNTGRVLVGKEPLVVLIGGNTGGVLVGKEPLVVLIGGNIGGVLVGKEPLVVLTGEGSTCEVLVGGGNAL